MSLKCTLVLTKTQKSVPTMTTLLLCVCLGTCWLNCGCLSVTQATSAPETHTPWTHPQAWHGLIPPFEPYWVLWCGIPNFSVCLSGCGQQTTQLSQSNFTKGDSCKSMCEKTNHLKPHSVKHGMWIKVPCISAHHVLIGKGCGFERSGEEFEYMA